MQRSSWKATVDTWKRTAIRAIIICLGLEAQIRRYFIDAVPKGKQYDYSQPTVQGVQYGNGYLPLKTSLTKNIPVIMKSGSSCVSRRKNLFWRLSGRGSISRSLSGIAGWIKCFIMFSAGVIQRRLIWKFTNNLSENAIWTFAVGRKNWLFSNSVEGANASAIVYIMIEIAKAHGLCCGQAFL